MAGICMARQIMGSTGGGWRGVCFVLLDRRIYLAAAAEAAKVFMLFGVLIFIFISRWARNVRSFWDFY